MRYEKSSGEGGEWILGKTFSLLKGNTEGTAPYTRFLEMRQPFCHHEESKSVEAIRGEKMGRTRVLDVRATEE